MVKHEGHIYEVAVTRCGSAAALAAAVERGAALKRTINGQELFFFPQVSIGKCRSSKGGEGGWGSFFAFFRHVGAPGLIELTPTRKMCKTHQFSSKIEPG